LIKRGVKSRRPGNSLLAIYEPDFRAGLVELGYNPRTVANLVPMLRLLNE
jgi:hypothetical protein